VGVAVSFGKLKPLVRKQIALSLYPILWMVDCKSISFNNLDTLRPIILWACRLFDYKSMCLFGNVYSGILRVAHRINPNVKKNWKNDQLEKNWFLFFIAGIRHSSLLKSRRQWASQELMVLFIQTTQDETS
jgi:hypothetical protein